MAKHSSYITSEDARGQAEFYTQALGGEIISVTTYGEVHPQEEDLKDKVIHLSLVAAGVTFLMSDSFHEPVSYGNAINQCLEFATEEEAQTAFDRLAEGGVVREPFKPAFWGAMFGQLVDKYGVSWMIITEPPCFPS
jgi:PhnB protein